MRLGPALVLVWVAQVAAADAVVVTRAMTATTIMEAFIDEDGIHIELEIGEADAPALRALVDDTGELPRPLAADAGLTILADGRPIPGLLRTRARRERVERDEITGEPLPRAGSEEVTFVELRYSFHNRPKTLVIQPPLTEDGYAAANIGFVIYHQGIAINDFRYLAAGERLRLDWDDPFYSRFERRALNRKYGSPMNVFVYVEPFEVRKEFVVRPLDLARFTDLDVRPHESIPANRRDALLAQIASYLQERAPLTIDGQTPEPILDRVHFLKRGLRMTRVVSPEEPVDGTSAIIGAIFVYPTDGMPQEVRLTWDLFDERVERVPASATDEAGPMPYFLTREDPELHWQNYLKGTRFPGELYVEHLESHLGVPVLLALAAVVALVLLVLGALRRSWVLIAAAVGVVALGWVVPSPTAVDVPIPAEAKIPSREEAAPTIHALLHNAYRALDFREEEVVFDRLAQSLSGDVLERVYLEMRQGLRLENQGGARVRVRGVALHDVIPRGRNESGQLQYRALWNVAGSVGHWGHTHIRTNAYDALLTLAELDGRWKIADIEILEERRVVPGQP